MSLSPVTAAINRATAARPAVARPCGHDGCTKDATHQHQRPATSDEANAHFDALEQNIIASGNPDYVHNRNDTVTIAEYRCDQHKPEATAND